VAAVIVAAGAGFGVGAALAPTSPAAARRAATAQATTALHKTLAAADAAGSFHYVEESDQGGQTETITGDATSRGGTQDIVLGTDHWHLVLVGTALYFSGNAAALVDQLGVPASVAGGDAGHWISVPRSTGNLYQTLAVGITTSSNLAQITASDGLGFAARSVTTGTAGSTAVTEIHGIIGSASGAPVNTATLIVATTSDLPIALQARVSGAGTSESFDWMFSGWHRPVALHAPKHAIPYAALGATPPASSGSGGPPAQGPTSG